MSCHTPKDRESREPTSFSYICSCCVAAIPRRFKTSEIRSFGRFRSKLNIGCPLSGPLDNCHRVDSFGLMVKRGKLFGMSAPLLLCDNRTPLYPTNLNESLMTNKNNLPG